MKHLQTKNLLLYCVQFLIFISPAHGSLKSRWQNTTPLASGTTITREIKDGEVHSYQIHLSANQFVDALVDKKGVEVEVVTFSPDLKEITRTDSPNGTNGHQPVLLIANIAGEYRIEIHSKSKQTGQYILHVVAVRESTSADKEHFAAENNFAAAQKLRTQRTAAKLREALEKYQQALQFYEASGNVERRALALYIMGTCYASLGEFRQSLVFFKSALAIFRQLGDRAMESSTLNFIGGASDVLGEPTQALANYQQALELARTAKKQSSEASILNNIGKIYFDVAEWQKAVDHFNEAKLLFQELGDKEREAQALDNIGAAWYRVNDLEKALEFHQKSFAIRQTVGEKGGEARTLERIGEVYAARGETQKAVENFQLALPLLRTSGNRYLEATTLNNLGDALSNQGNYAKALESLQQALQLSRVLEDKRGEALTYERFGTVYVAMKQPQKALENYMLALTNFRAVLDAQYEAKTLQGIARAERDLGNLDVARQRIESALSLYENVRTKVNSQQSRASYFAVQQTAYQFYTDLLMKLHQQNPSAGHDAAALQITERARARSLLELLSESKVDFRQGVDTKLLDRERELMLQINAKAARLLQRNSANTIATLKKEIGDLEDEYQQAQTAIRQSNPHYAAASHPQPLSVSAIQKELDENTLLLEYALGEERSFVWVVTNNSLISYELPKQSEIKPVAQQVYESLTARTLVISGETPSVRQARITKADAQFTEASTKLSAMLLAPLASQLGNKRLVIVADGALQYVPFGALPECGLGNADCGLTAASPSEKVATGRIVPHSAIRIPQSALPLIVNHEIITLPSASVIGVMRKELAGRTVAPKMLAVIADPVFTADDERAKISKVKMAKAGSTETAARGIVHEDAKSSGDQKMSGGLKIPRLPFTHQEADQIFALAPKASSFRATDFKASRATVTDPELGNYRYLHFATHGLLDSEKPGLSSLVLSMLDEQGQPQDGFFRAHELYNLKLPAELVVLSACQTGLGKEIKGEGLVGLTRGFMYAGAARVIVSLWSVNDKATAELMTKLYQSMLQKGESPAAALRSAQVAMWKQKQWNAPYYWAAFTLQGEWK